MRNYGRINRELLEEANPDLILSGFTNDNPPAPAPAPAPGSNPPAPGSNPAP